MSIPWEGSMTTEIISKLQNEYDYCDTNIRFIHEQRDRWIRYYIGLIGALQGIPIAVVTVLSQNDVSLNKTYFALFVCSTSILLYAIGVLVLMTCVYARCRTTEFTNEINRLRRILLKNIGAVCPEASDSILPQRSKICAYQRKGADHFRHMTIIFIQSLFIPVVIIAYLKAVTTYVIIVGTIGFGLSVVILLMVRKKVLVDFDALQQVRREAAQQLHPTQSVTSGGRDM